MEVMIALVLIIVGAVGALRLIGVAVINVGSVRDQIIATNLAREGIEAVRDIRDTNWLRYAGERRGCWNNNNITMCNSMDATQRIQPTSTTFEYIAERDALTQRWNLTGHTGGASLDLKAHIVATNDGLDGIYQLYQTASGLIYGRLAGMNAGDTATPWYRSVGIEYLDDTGTTVTAVQPAPPTNNHVMRVTSRVQWIDRSRVREVVLSTILTDYLGRTNHN